MQSKVEKFIRDEKLLKDNSKVILGVSGGADSMALLHILHNLNYQIIVAHCNFHLRSNESMRDEKFVRSFCEEKGLLYRVVDFDTLKYAAQHSISIEMAARELRYRWFEELRKEFEADAIAVAHHKDDSIETVIMNMVRGTGIRGLTGIEPKSGYIVRPFLSITRAEVEEYMLSSGLEYVNDSTNSESIYTRNIIRLDVMPYFERINSSAKDSIYKTMKNLKQVENIYKSYINDCRKKVFKDDKIDINKLTQLVEPEAVLYEILSEFNFNAAVVNDILESLKGHSGKIFYSNSHKVLKDRDFLILKVLLDDVEETNYIIDVDQISEIKEPINLLINKEVVNEDFVLDRSPLLLYADYDKLGKPLQLRRWKEGDWFIPFGMKGKKKLSDYFNDNKFSLFDKENTWLLCSDQDIVWIVGHRSDDRFKIDPKTKTVLKISLIKE